MRLYSIERQLQQILHYEEYTLERQSVVYRPTELLCISKLDDGERHAWEYEVVTQAPPQVECRTCITCKTNARKPLTEFDRVANNHTGYSWSCTECRRKNKRRTWRDVPQEGKWGNWKTAA